MNLDLAIGIDDIQPSGRPVARPQRLQEEFRTRLSVFEKRMPLDRDDEGCCCTSSKTKKRCLVMETA